jgi:hypothetical protein
MLVRWSTLKPQGKDGLVKLDLDTLLDIFEAAGIAISDEHAAMCLSSLPTNVIHRHSIKDILTWLRRYQVHPPPRNPAPWRLHFFRYRESFVDSLTWCQQWIDRILTQDKLNKDVVAFRKKAEERRLGEEEKDAAGRKKAARSSFESVIKGSLRLSGWQRQRHMSKPSKVGLLATFGPRIIQSLSDGLNAKKSKVGKNSSEIQEVKTKWGTKISIEVFTRPGGKKRESIVGPDGIVKEFNNLTPADWMNHFDGIGYVPEMSEAEAATAAAYAAARAAGLSIGSLSDSAPHGSGCITWIVIRVAQGATAQEAYCLQKTATNFFESIPLDYRHEIYTLTKSQLFYLEPEKETKDESNGKSPQPARVICIALLHERDPYKSIEDKIEAANLLFTRAMRSLKLDFRILKTLDELFESSSKFDNFQDRLFGPQEEELGEEGMNPLRFAKLCRKRQQAAQEAIAKAPNMPLDELKKHLTSRGLSEKGTKEEIVIRAQEAFKRQAEMIGFGEMSQFGAEMVQCIFDLFDEDKDGALSLMEMNKFLIATGSEALYDMKAYKSLMASEGLLLDNHYRLTLEGLTAYYEKYGRLSRDITRLGIGSLSRELQAECELRLEFEPESIYSLYAIMERNTLAQMFFKHVTGSVSALTDVFYCGVFPTIDEFTSLFRLNKIPFTKEFCNELNKPGWLSSMIHSYCAWLADGEDGLIPALRTNSKNKFQKYYNFIKVFEALHVPEVEEGPDDVDEDKDDNTAATSGYSTTSGYSNTGPPEPPPVVLTSAEQIDKALNDPYTRKEYSQMFQVFYKNAVVKPIDATDDNDEDETEKCRPLEPKHPEIEKWIAALDLALPRIIAYTSKKMLTVEEIHQRLTAASVIYDRLSSNERFTRTERDRLQRIKTQCERRAFKLSAQLEESVHLCSAHFIAFYDAFRLYGAGIDQIGMGTAESGLKVQVDGISWLHYLPPGLGEPSAARQTANDKYERAMRRKNAAMNAIERERLRRELDEEAREKRRQWETANQQLFRDEEEKKMFVEAYAALIGAREATLTPKDVEEILTMWRNIVQVRRDRYPATMKLVVILNDLACVLFELCGNEPLAIAEAVAHLREASSLVMEYVQDMLDTEVGICVHHR